mgnify:FL=1
MRRLINILSIIIILTGMALAYSLNWANYEYINPASDVTRSLAYSYETDHLYLATRIDNQARVVILDPESGEKIGMLDTTDTGFQGGTYRLNQVAVSDDGTIYVCNLSVPSANADDKFKIYRYTDENSAPELIFEDAMDGMRYGDSFAAIGSGDNTYLYSSAYQSENLAVFKVTSRVTTVEKIITLPEPGAARQGVSPVEPGGNIWINGVDSPQPPVRLIDYDGNIVAEVPDTIISGGGSSTVQQWQVGSLNIVTATNAFESNTLRSALYSEDELGTITFDYLGGNSDSIMLAYQGTTLNQNLNGSCALEYDSTRHCLYTLMGVNSVSSVNLDSLIQVATPRDTGYLAIQLDGQNREYTHYEKLATEDNRSLYFTWSDDIVYTAISGNTLYAPYQERGLYIAYNTDPAGGNGTTTPPDEASGIQELPFDADVVVKMDSDDWADLETAPVTDKWTTGIVYQWNGSEWTENVVEGLDINYGAMCIIGDGNDSLITEVGVARSPQGIGTDVEQMQVKIYLAETASDGDVLASFPNNGETGNGVAFNSYYEFNDLGNGVYPAFAVEEVGTGTEVIENNYKAKKYNLSQNYPNPFNPMTTIEYSIPHSGKVDLSIFNLQGQLITKLVQKEQKAGIYKYNFHAGDYASGVYFYKLSVDGASVGMKKMLLIK